ncbi:MAG: hypothetical protein JO149_07385 [Gammaproteobacteria bacterium]|nr:hypothetical protein [Gammaproteobacteria bacterium]
MFGHKFLPGIFNTITHEHEQTDKLAKAYMDCANAFFNSVNFSAWVNAEMDASHDARVTDIRQRNIVVLESAVNYYKNAILYDKKNTQSVLTEQDKQIAFVNSAEAYMRLASYCKQEVFKKAAYYQNAVFYYTQAIKNNYQRAYQDRGELYELLANASNDVSLLENAISDYTEALRLVCKEINQSDEKEKKKKTNHMIELYLARGDLYYRQGAYDKALADYIKAVANDAYSVPQFVLVLRALQQQMKEVDFYQYFFALLLQLNAKEKDLFFGHCLAAKSNDYIKISIKAYYADLRNLFTENEALFNKIEKTTKRILTSEENQNFYHTLYYTFFDTSKKSRTENAIFYAELDEDDYGSEEEKKSIKEIETLSNVRLLRR